MKFPLLFLRLGLGLLLLSLIGVIIGLFAGKSLPYTGELAYISANTGNNNLYLLDVQREFKFPIKGYFINDCCLTWSPDGRTLTYIVDMSSDGSTDIFSTNFHAPAQRLTTMTGADLYPAYSPDGSQIAYMGYGYGNPEIYLMKADGSRQHVLTGRKLLTNLNPHPVWSADGKSVLFSDFNNLDSLLAVPADCADPCEDSIHPIFNTNGLPLMTTTFIPLDQSRLFLAAFERTKQGGYAMYSLDTQSTQAPERLTINADLASPSVAIYSHWIAFISGNTDLTQAVDDPTLYILDGDCIGSAKGCAGSIQRITGNLRAEDNLSWSADGRWLAFVTLKDRVSYLNLLDTACVFEHQDCATSIHPQPITSARYIRPAWRPRLQ